MKNTIHIFGASGSGTTTLAKSLSDRLNFRHIDTDDYFWEPTSQPFTTIRPVEGRQKLLQNELINDSSWILSGSLCGWGDMFIPYFDLVIFVYLPKEIRMERLKKREHERYGSRISYGGEMYEKSKEFLDWAGKYEDSTEIGRNLRRHEQWLMDIPCPILRVDNSVPLLNSANEIFNAIMR